MYLVTPEPPDGIGEVVGLGITGDDTGFCGVTGLGGGDGVGLGFRQAPYED